MVLALFVVKLFEFEIFKRIKRYRRRRLRKQKLKQRQKLISDRRQSEYIHKKKSKNSLNQDSDYEESVQDTAFNANNNEEAGSENSDNNDRDSMDSIVYDIEGEMGNSDFDSDLSSNSEGTDMSQDLKQVERMFEQDYLETMECDGNILDDMVNLDMVDRDYNDYMNDDLYNDISGVKQGVVMGKPNYFYTCTTVVAIASYCPNLLLSFSFTETYNIECDAIEDHYDLDDNYDTRY